MRVQLAGLSPQLEIKYQSKARDQKQLYRLYETKSHSGVGGFEICQAVSFALFGPLIDPIR